MCKATNWSFFPHIIRTCREVLLYVTLVFLKTYYTTQLWFPISNILKSIFALMLDVRSGV